MDWKNKEFQLEIVILKDMYIENCFDWWLIRLGVRVWF